jgi:hypothetical protein
MAVLGFACTDYPCTPADFGRPAPEGEAALYAWWSPNALPLKLVVDPEQGCPVEVVQAEAEYWAPYSGGFEVVAGKFRSGKDRGYAHVYLRTGTPPHGWSGHTQLTALGDGRAMYASVTVDERCDPAVIRHELGHALGLDEAYRRGAVMQPSEDTDGMELTQGEADRLAYACE